MRINLTENYFIEQCPYAPFNWDLYLRYTGTRKGETQEIEKPAGVYGLSLSQIIEKVADYQIEMSEEKELELKEYVEKFERIQKEAIREINKVAETFKKEI